VACSPSSDTSSSAPNESILLSAHFCDFPDAKLTGRWVPRFVAQALQHFSEEETLPLVERSRRVSEIILDLTNDVLSSFFAH
jgi:hypothetical protein